MNKVLICEDVPALREHAANLVRTTLGPDTLPLQPTDALSALQAFQREKPSMILMDIMMKQVSGIKAAEQIWAENANAKIIFWSHCQSEAYVRALGRILPEDAVHGYVLKSEGDDKLRHAISAVFVHDNPYIDPTIRNLHNRVQSSEDTMTEAEYETLIDVVVGLTDKSIARRRGLSVRGAQNRLASLSAILLRRDSEQFPSMEASDVCNIRTRMIFEAIRRGFVSSDQFEDFERDLQEWLNKERFATVEESLPGPKYHLNSHLKAV